MGKAHLNFLTYIKNNNQQYIHLTVEVVTVIPNTVREFLCESRVTFKVSTRWVQNKRIFQFIFVDTGTKLVFTFLFFLSFFKRNYIHTCI